MLNTSVLPASSVREMNGKLKIDNGKLTMLNTSVVPASSVRDKKDPPYAICVIRNSVQKSHYPP